jgi:4-amino-4-deoxy-L-arabinose transferase-like glycosyltransferase
MNQAEQPFPPKTADRPGCWQGSWSPGAVVAFIIALGTVTRLALIASIGVEIDGTYSAVIARQLSLSYLDHPPLHLWLIHAFVALLGESAFAVHLPFVLLFMGTTWLMYRATALAFGAWAGVWAAATLNLAGALGFAYGFLAVPDGPLFFFLLLAAFCLLHVVFDADAPRATRWWLGAGAALGLAMLSKYSAALIGTGLVLFLLTTREGRRWLRRPAPWLAGALAFALLAPVVVWNMQHDWASFVFQGQRAAPSADGGVLPVLGSLAAQAAYLLPWFFVGLAWVGLRALRAGPARPAQWFFACLALFPIVVFTLLNLFQRGLPHWPMPGWLMVVPLFGAMLAALGERARRWMRGLAWTGAVTGVLAAAAVVAEVHTGMAGAAVARTLPPTVNFRDPLFDLLDWTVLRTELARRGATPDDRFIASAHWITAAKVGFGAGPERAAILLCSGEPHHFPFMTDWAALAGRDGFVMERADLIAGILPCLRTRFAALERLPDIVIVRDGRPGARLAVFRARGLKAP